MRCAQRNFPDISPVLDEHQRTLTTALYLQPKQVVVRRKRKRAEEERYKGNEPHPVRTVRGFPFARSRSASLSFSSS
jgi:hypothetical protein